MAYEDDEEGKPKTLEQVDLEPLSIEALELYIEERKAEIERAKAMIDSKKAARGAAASFFKN